jgi:phytoene synthase
MRTSSTSRGAAGSVDALGLALDASFVNRAAPPGSMRYFSLLYAPPERRDALLALYVIESEIRWSAQGASHDVAHTRLQWWRAEIERLVNGAPQHPATRLLHERGAARERYDRLHELLAAADMDLAHMTYENEGELRAYCARSGGTTHELIAAELLAPQPLEEPVRAVAHRLGVGIRISEILRDLRQDAHEGRVYLPLDQLDRQGLDHRDLRVREMPPALRPLLQSVRELACHELSPPTAHSGGPDLRPASARLRPLLVLAALHRRLLDRIAARDYDVLSERVELGPVEKPWIAWRAARKSG